MSDQRVDELFVIQPMALTVLENLFEEMQVVGWPPELEGELSLALTKAGKWRARGRTAGVAEWDLDGMRWRIRIACPVCGSEWWDDEPAPRNPCCQSADFDGRER